MDRSEYGKTKAASTRGVRKFRDSRFAPPTVPNRQEDRLELLRLFLSRDLLRLFLSRDLLRLLLSSELELLLLEEEERGLLRRFSRLELLRERRFDLLREWLRERRLLFRCERSLERDLLFLRDRSMERERLLCRLILRVRVRSSDFDLLVFFDRSRERDFLDPLRLLLWFLLRDRLPSFPLLPLLLRDFLPFAERSLDLGQKVNYLNFKGETNFQIELD